MKKIFPTALLLVFPCMLQATTVYKWVDENGDIHYSDTLQNQPAEKIDIRPGPDAAKIEKAKQREKVLRKTAEELQKNREQRQTQEQEAKREKQKQQRKKERQAQAEEKKKEPREGRSEGYYQKQWQQQLPPQHPAPEPFRH